MTDFYADSLPCRFASSVHDFVRWRHRNHQADSIKGTYFVKGQTICIVPLASDRARLSIWSPGNAAHLDIETSLVKPNFGPAQHQYHWLFGQTASRERFYVFRRADKDQILLWRFAAGNATPVDDKLIRDPAVQATLMLRADDPEFPFVVGTQNDDGSGEEPIP
ncbi:MAG: hypothetical protein DYH17_01355 [Xanthomonadales bacterium PRO6]|nr:hypothetical protein [Xanthomonadales bacterium]MCE7930012.1 hypothetical protein [Xanthomonadales bacterium PRO6]